MLIKRSKYCIVTRILLGTLFIGLGSSWSSGQSSVELLNILSISGSATDLSNLRDEILPGVPHNQFGGISAMEWTGRGNEFWVLPDRGPSDGAAHYQCRLHRVRLPIEPQVSAEVEILETVMLRDSRGVPFLGSSTLFVSTGDQPRRFDPEGLRLERDGNFLISDEYGPHLIRFNRQGVMIEELPVPQSFTVENPSANGQEEDANNTRGRRANRGMEGLAVTPDKRYVVGLMQSPLLQDAELSDSGKPVGLNSRLWWFDQETGKQRQLVYRQAHREHKMHEILAIDNHEFLVIEQDGKAGEAATYKKIVKIALQGATEIADDSRLPPGDLPESIRPVSKTDFIDLLAPEFGLVGPTMPEKIEGLCWGPQLADGRRLLVVATDNDFKSSQDTVFYLFAISGLE